VSTVKKPTHELIYSFKFGQNVVEEFTERYARGTDFLVKMSGTSHEKLCRYLILCVCSRNQVQWEAMKRMIKLCERESFTQYRSIPLEQRRKYLSIVKYNAQDQALSEIEARRRVLDTHSGQSVLF